MNERQTMLLQRTLKKVVRVNGIGLHRGQPTHVTLRPAPPETGIVFVRSDLEEKNEIIGRFENVTSTQLATTVGEGAQSVSTIEHIMAALYGMDIDNVIIEVDGPEIPISDGSSGEFYQKLKEAGVETQFRPRTVVKVLKRVEIKVGEKWAIATPSKEFEIHASIEWDHPSIGFQEFHYTKGKTPFEELADARTFGFLRDVEAMRRTGLARGGSLDNAIVLDEAGVLNPEGLRYPDEFIRHKVLDSLGDLKLSGMDMQASIRMHRPGHELHVELLKAIFSDKRNYEIVKGNPSKEKEAFEPALVSATA